MDNDPVHDIEEQIRALFSERNELLNRRALGMPLRTDEVQEAPDNVIVFPYKEQAYVNLRQEEVGKDKHSRPYPY